MEFRNNIEIYERDYLLCCHYGDYNRALELSKKLYGIRRELLGEEDPKTVQALKMLNEIKAKIERNS